MLWQCFPTLEYDLGIRRQVLPLRLLGHLVKRHLFQSLPPTSYCGCPKLKTTADLNKKI